MKKLKGRPVSPGYARGYACVLGTSRVHVPRYRIERSATREELKRFERALESVAEDLVRVRHHVEAEIGRTEAEIFDAHLALLRDRQLRARVGARIEGEQINAEWAVHATVNDYAERLEGADNEYLRERSADIRDLGRRLLRHLVPHNARPLSSLPAQSVLVARELYPADLLEIDRSHLVAIVTESGGQTGHAAILSRALGIPAISGMVDITQTVAPGALLLVDGIAGEVCIDPSPAEEARLAAFTADYQRGFSAALSEEYLASETRDGISIRLLGNIGRAHEAGAIGRHGLEGIGLFRTEYLFLDEAEAPGLDKQKAIYRAVAEDIGDRPLVIRTLDLGGDKFPRFLASDKEEHPIVGLRGLRFSLGSGRPLFETQIKAILSVAALGRDVRILLPMVLGPFDFAAAQALIRDVTAREHLGTHVQVGAMIETPAAILTIEEILGLADFVSLGTNDLTQFILAADRNAVELDTDHPVLHLAVLRAIKMVADAGHRASKPVTLCGEAAADPLLTEVFLGLGIRNLSMSPTASVRVRQRIRSLDTRAATALTDRALRGESVRCS